MSPNYLSEGMGEHFGKDRQHLQTPLVFETLRKCSIGSKFFPLTLEAPITTTADHSNRKGAFFIRKMLISFLFLIKNKCCGYSLEVPW